MEPMLLGKVVEGDEVLPVAQQRVRRGRLTLKPELGHIEISTLFRLSSGRCIPDGAQLLAHRTTETLGQLVQDVERSMVLMPMSA